MLRRRAVRLFSPLYVMVNGFDLSTKCLIHIFLSHITIGIIE